MTSAICFYLDQSKIESSGNGSNNCSLHVFFRQFFSSFNRHINFLLPQRRKLKMLLKKKEILMLLTLLTHYQTTNFRPFQEFADDNFKFDENGRKLSKRVENTVGKGKIARNEQFLLFPQCFQKACVPRASKGVIVWEWVKYEIFPY